MKRLTLILALLMTFVVQAAPPTSRPAQVAVYLQPKRNLATWASRGVTLAIGRDREENADGSDGVSLAGWQDAARAAGLKYILEPSADLAADARDPNRLGWLNPQDEPDGKIIDAQDMPDKAAGKVAEEAVYVALEQFYVKCKAVSPTMPVWVNVDGHQCRYKRSNYPRIFRAADRITIDFYPIQRAEPVTAYAEIIDQVKAFAGGEKLALAWVETGYQHLNTDYFHGGRPPKVDEWTAEVQLVLDRKLWVGWFPQCIGEDRLAPFSTDATTPEIAAAMVAWLKPAGAVSAATGATTQPAADPFAGTVIVLPSGKTYVLQPK